MTATDVMAGLGFGVAIGWGVLCIMLATHLLKGLRLDAAQERTAIGYLMVIAVFSLLERGVLAILTTPTNLQNAANLSMMIYVVPVVARFGLGVALWLTIRYVWFVYWPTQQDNN